MELDNSELRYKKISELSSIVCNSGDSCASNLSGIEILSCIRCNKQKLSHIPISKNERYTINFDNDSINLEFK